MTQTADIAPNTGADPWMTPAEAADYARCSRITIYRAASSGTLSGAKLNPKLAKSPWRFRRSDIDAWLDGQRPIDRAIAAGRRQRRRS